MVNDKLIINQGWLAIPNFQLDLKDEFVNNLMPLTGGSTGKILIRGYGYCDQVNSVHALALNFLGDDAVLLALKDSSGYSKHTIIKLKSEDFFLDYWIEPVKFILHNDEFVSLSPGSNDTFKVYNKFFIEPYDVKNSYKLNDYSAQYRLEKFLKVSKQYVTKAFNTSGEIVSNKNVDTAKKIDLASDANILHLKNYLLARYYMLEGDRVSAIHFLRKNFTGCLGYFCKASSYMLMKIE